MVRGATGDGDGRRLLLTDDGTDMAGESQDGFARTCMLQSVLLVDFGVGVVLTYILSSTLWSRRREVRFDGQPCDGWVETRADSVD